MLVFSKDSIHFFIYLFKWTQPKKLLFFKFCSRTNCLFYFLWHNLLHKQRCQIFSTFYFRKKNFLFQKNLFSTKILKCYRKHRRPVSFIGVSLLLLPGTNKIHNILFKNVNFSGYCWIYWNFKFSRNVVLFFRSQKNLVKWENLATLYAGTKSAKRIHIEDGLKLSAGEYRSCQNNFLFFVYFGSLINFIFINPHMYWKYPSRYSLRKFFRITISKPIIII